MALIRPCGSSDLVTFPDRKYMYGNGASQYAVLNNITGQVTIPSLSNNMTVVGCKSFSSVTFSEGTNVYLYHADGSVTYSNSTTMSLNGVNMFIAIGSNYSMTFA